MDAQAESEFRDFVRTRFNRLGRFAYLLCRDWDHAEDIVQKSLAKLYRKWTKVASGSPEAYVRRIIINVAHDESRLAWFRRERASREIPDRISADHSETGATRVTMLWALGKLPKRQQQAVVLRHWEDLSVAQTAEIMGCTAGAVKSQTAKGVQALRGLLQESLMTQETVGRK